MEILQGFVSQSPVLLAAVAFTIAAMLKLGRERGAVMTLLGAIGMFLIALATPIVYHGIMPRMIGSIEADQVRNVYTGLGFLFHLGQALSVGLVTVGTFVRPPAR